ncbi:hypothetical protein DFJ74DRAFT_682829 [Hyaloraphidium curvatum]|nr:hypothetical protein DFJ74DRAFT_682829 [Hyaloraphidium curvatum]
MTRGKEDARRWPPASVAMAKDPMPNNERTAVPAHIPAISAQFQAQAHGIRVLRRSWPEPSLTMRRSVPASAPRASRGGDARTSRDGEHVGSGPQEADVRDAATVVITAKSFQDPSTLHALPTPVQAARRPGTRCHAPCPRCPARRRRRAPGCAAAGAARVGPSRFRPPARIRASTGRVEGAVRGGDHEVGFRGFAGSDEGRRPPDGAVARVCCRGGTTESGVLWSRGADCGCP